jgi:membrane associated rhomboid family serine protease
LYGRGYNTSGFGPPITPTIIKNLLIANCAVYVAQLITSQSGLVTSLGVVSPAQVWLGFELWRPFTYMWLHSTGGGLPLHLLFNMFALWMFGSPLAMAWGEQRFLRFYLICGVGAGILIATVPFIPVVMGLREPTMGLAIPTLGASGAVMGLLLAYSFSWPDRTIMLIFPPIPIKAIWLIPLIMVMELTSGPSNVSHVGHLGGIVVGWIYLYYEGRTPGVPSLETIKLRWRRYQMRKKLRAVQEEDRRKRRRRHPDDRTYH